MKNADVEDPPLRYVNRDPLWVLLFIALSLILTVWTSLLFMAIQPMALLLMIPAGFSLFHTLWILLNPFAGIYTDKIILKPWVLGQKVCYFTDIENAGLSKQGHLIIKYRDGDTELVKLSGIQKKQVSELLSAILEGRKP